MPDSTITLGAIETAAKTYDAASAELEAGIADLEADLAAVKNKHLRTLKRLAAKIAGIEAEGLALVAEAPHLFVKPRTLVISGVKCGFTNREGRLVCRDEAKAIQIINESDLWDAERCLNIKCTLDKDALKEFSADSLKEIGCRIEGAGDGPIFRRTAGETEKLLNKLISKMVEAITDQED